MISTYSHLHSSLIHSPRKPSNDRRSNQLRIRIYPRRPPRDGGHESRGNNVRRPAAELDGKGNKEDASHGQTRQLGRLGVAKLSVRHTYVDHHLLPEDGLDGQVGKGRDADGHGQAEVEVFAPWGPVLLDDAISG